MKHFYTLSIAMLLGLTASATLPEPDAGYSDWTLIGTGSVDVSQEVDFFPYDQSVYTISVYSSENPQTGGINYFFDGFMPSGVMMECSDRTLVDGRVSGTIRGADTGLTYYNDEPVYVYSYVHSNNSRLISYYRPMIGVFSLDFYLCSEDARYYWYFSHFIQLEGNFPEPYLDIEIAGTVRETGQLKLNVTMQDVSDVTLWVYPWPEGSGDDDFVSVLDGTLPEGGIEARPTESGPLYFDLPSDGDYLITYARDEGDIYSSAMSVDESILISHYTEWHDWGTTDILNPIWSIDDHFDDQVVLTGLKVQRYGSEEIYRILNPFDNSVPVTSGVLTIDNPEIETEIIIDARDSEHCRIGMSNLGVSDCNGYSYDIVSWAQRPYGSINITDSEFMDENNLWGKREGNVITFPAGHYRLLFNCSMRWDPFYFHNKPSRFYGLYYVPVEELKEELKEWSVSIAPDPAGIESIAADGDINDTPAVYYDLNGRCVGSDADALHAGIYIRVQGRTVTKEIVK